MSSPTEQTAVMASSLARVRSPTSTALRQGGVFTHGHERAGEAAHRGRGETPLLDRIVQQGQCRSRARSADPDHAHRLEDFPDAVADLGRGRQRKVNDPERDAEPCGDLASDQLPNPRVARKAVLLISSAISPRVKRVGRDEPASLRCLP